MGKQITHTYIIQQVEDLVTIVRRQTWKVWDYGDVVVYGYPGGKMVAYHFLERGDNSEVLEEAPIGWCPPSGPAIVYEMEVGLTNNPECVLIGNYVRRAYAAHNTPLITAPVTSQCESNNYKKGEGHQRRQQQQHQSIPLALPVRGAKKDMYSHKKNHQSIPLMSIPLCA